MRIGPTVATRKQEDDLACIQTKQAAERPSDPAGPRCVLPPAALAAAGGVGMPTSSWACGVVVEPTGGDVLPESLCNPDGAGNGHNGLFHPVKVFCFAAQTPILTVRGRRSIASLRPGDRVLAFDQDRGSVAEARVSTVEAHRGDFPLFAVGSADDQLRVTRGHRFHDREGWRAVERFDGARRGLDVRQRGVPLQVRASRARARWVYNLRVEGLQSYFVGVRGLLVRDH